MSLLAGIRWWWKWRGFHPKASIADAKQPVHTENAVLKTTAERDAAIARVEQLGLPIYEEPSKNWDSLAALSAIVSRTGTSARVLDAGSVPEAVILPWLSLFGYRDLIGINLDVKRPFHVGPIRYERGDITKTPYESASFDAITCLSVIEHGVPVVPYLAEMARLLKPGGVLITSTDYWHEPVDTKGKTAWGSPVKVFVADEIRAILRDAEAVGLRPTTDIDLACQDKVVHWTRQNLDYTFVVFTFTRA